MFNCLQENIDQKCKEVVNVVELVSKRKNVTANSRSNHTHHTHQPHTKFRNIHTLPSALCFVCNNSPSYKYTAFN